MASACCTGPHYVGDSEEYLDNFECNCRVPVLKDKYEQLCQDCGEIRPIQCVDCGGDIPPGFVQEVVAEFEERRNNIIQSDRLFYNNQVYRLRMIHRLNPGFKFLFIATIPLPKVGPSSIIFLSTFVRSL